MKQYIYNFTLTKMLLIISCLKVATCRLKGRPGYTEPVKFVIKAFLDDMHVCLDEYPMASF